jgi:hypothetical protein
MNDQEQTVLNVDTSDNPAQTDIEATLTHASTTDESNDVQFLSLPVDDGTHVQTAGNAPLPQNTGTGIIIPTSIVEPLNEDENPTMITASNFELLKEDLELFEQMEPLLITPDPEAPGHFRSLGGNRRLQGLKALGRDTVWGSVVEFFLDENTQLWKAKLNGVITKATFESKDSAIVQYTLKHNNKYSEYVKEKLDALVASIPEIDPTKFLVTDRAQTLDDLLNSIAPGARPLNPEFKYQLVIEVENSDAAEQLFTRMSEEGYNTKVRAMAKRKK